MIAILVSAGRPSLRRTAQSTTDLVLIMNRGVWNTPLRSFSYPESRATNSAQYLAILRVSRCLGVTTFGMFLFLYDPLVQLRACPGGPTLRDAHSIMLTTCVCVCVCMYSTLKLVIDDDFVLPLALRTVPLFFQCSGTLNLQESPKIIPARAAA